MLERNGAKLLNGAAMLIWAANAPVNGARRAAGKTPFVAALAVTEDGKPDRILPRRVAGFSKKAIGKLARKAPAPDAHVISDGLSCFAEHAPPYLAEFEYRYNRRYKPKAMIDRLAYVAARTPPMPYALLKLADPCA
jgi:hypothetical protein